MQFEFQEDTGSKESAKTTDGQDKPLQTDGPEPANHAIQQPEPTTAPIAAAKPDENENGKTVNVAPKPKRGAVTVNFTPDEMDYLAAILQARMQSGLTENMGHLLKQAIDFALHIEQVAGTHPKGLHFAIPKIARVKFQKGFFKD